MQPSARHRNCTYSSYHTFRKQLGDVQKADHNDKQRDPTRSRSRPGSRRRLRPSKRGGGPLLAIAKIPPPPLSLSSLKVPRNPPRAQPNRRREERSAYSRSAANHAAQEKSPPTHPTRHHRHTLHETIGMREDGEARFASPLLMLGARLTFNLNSTFKKKLQRA